MQYVSPISGLTWKIWSIALSQFTWHIFTAGYDISHGFPQEHGGSPEVQKGPRGARLRAKHPHQLARAGLRRVSRDSAKGLRQSQGERWSTAADEAQKVRVIGIFSAEWQIRSWLEEIL